LQSRIASGSQAERCCGVHCCAATGKDANVSARQKAAERPATTRRRAVQILIVDRGVAFVVVSIEYRRSHQYLMRWSERERSDFNPKRETMPKRHKSGLSTLAHRGEISHLIHAYGITRDQARRLLSRIGHNRAKFAEAARILKARLLSRSFSEVK